MANGHRLTALSVVWFNFLEYGTVGDRQYTVHQRPRC
ncbi:unnamed protein product [Acanthoscelides obtectus]|uniref:Uncharacterized protein n=1 Tax=Acanthoscelides obtectus TaxID=200917 RepID=A0A9P0MND8_ACAOB|nr:unnamed protein product [Acanthoscelides obtectus]CAK1659991.1 hypothetical protein AOBTE_LOCUS21794 [Acanthoscelides obtectus]